MTRLAAALVRLAPLALAAIGLLLLWCGVADARPGGGHSYSGGGGSYSGGGGSYSGGGSSGSGGGELLVWLLLEVPELGVPLLLLGGGGYLWMRLQHREPLAEGWDSAPAIAPPPRVELDAVRRFDPAFSAVLFEDFAYRLYAEAHGARADAGRLAELAPYLGEEARAALAARSPVGAPVSGVVVGSMTVTRVDLPHAAADDTGTPYYTKLRLRFEANMTCGEGSDRRTQYVVEGWDLARAATAISRPAEATRALRCPACGAPFRSSDTHRCEHCDQVVDTGLFDWLVTGVHLHTLEDRPPSLAGHAPEQGTFAPTRAQPDLAARLERFRADDPAFDEAALVDRVELVHDAMNAAWNQQDLTAARPFVSDGLLSYLQYWIDAYRAQGLANRNEGAKLERYEIARITRDAHYDALTLRVWGTGFDHTVDARGRVVGGSRREARRYSEYWTLIRGAAVRGAPRTDKRCPNCGAPLAISMAGSCEHCDAHVTAGEFDWVLSTIEQDD